MFFFLLICGSTYIHSIYTSVIVVVEHALNSDYFFSSPPRFQSWSLYSYIYSFFIPSSLFSPCSKVLKLYILLLYLTNNIYFTNTANIVNIPPKFSLLILIFELHCCNRVIWRRKKTVLSDSKHQTYNEFIHLYSTAYSSGFSI